MKEIDISIVVPVYNESDNIETFYHALKQVLNERRWTYEILMVDDGSKDDSFLKIMKLSQEDPSLRGISLSRNFGHQIALAAGIDYARGNAVITMDADMQHPPALIPELVAKYHEGYDIVSTIRHDSADTGIFKRITSALYYQLINRLSDTKIEPAAADFRLMSRKTVEAFRQFHERGRFTRGLINWMGFKQVCIPYQAAPRHSGRSKYTVAKMTRLALDGITAFSSRPLRISFYIGLVISFIAFSYAVYACIVFMIGKTVPGWTSILLTLLFLGGIQLISIGILGEYLARVFHEVKGRPLYFVRADTTAYKS